MTPKQKTSLFDALRHQPPEVLREAAVEACGGFYIMSPSAVTAAVETLSASLRQEYDPAFVALSFKTNYSEALIEAGRRSGAMSEVVSATELAYAAGLGIPDSEIILNGPGKSRADLMDALGRDLILIVDSMRELECVADLIEQGIEARASIGIRMHPHVSFGCMDSRFGIDCSHPETTDRIRQIVRKRKVPLKGAHLHLASDRSAESFGERVTFLWETWTQLEIGPMGFLNCGGGMASEMPDELARQLGYGVATLETYGRAIGERMATLCPEGTTQLLCEPGTGVFAAAGAFVTPVLDVKRIRGRSIAVVDGTIFSVNPFRSTPRPVCFRISGAADRPEITHAASPPIAVYGNGCMEIDLLIEDFHAPLAVGDLIAFAQKGAYSSSIAPPFIQGIPAVFILTPEGKLVLERPRTDASLLRLIHGGLASLQTVEARTWEA
jgi:diaminopimelate decarboxylase